MHFVVKFKRFVAFQNYISLSLHAAICVMIARETLPLVFMLFVKNIYCCFLSDRGQNDEIEGLLAGRIATNDLIGRTMSKF